MDEEKNIEKEEFGLLEIFALIIIFFFICFALLARFSYLFLR
jgi:hypothetical protein